MNITPTSSIGFTSKVTPDIDSIPTKILREFGNDLRAAIKELESNGRDEP